jgi:hypothetical protein
VSLLTPWSALFAAAIALPLLVLLYFLKLRRQRLAIPSTLLWRKSFEDLSVNAPFQKMRWSLLLVLQLLALIALLLALAQPVARGDAQSADRVVLVIDAGASMNATSRTGRTRLETARAARNRRQTLQRWFHSYGHRLRLHRTPRQRLRIQPHGCRTGDRFHRR